MTKPASEPQTAPGVDGRIDFERDGRDFVLRARQWLPAAPETIWKFVGDCRHMNHVIPPFMRFEVRSVAPGQCPPAIAPGVTYDYKLHLHGLGFSWRTLITEVDRPRRFIDEQAKGPYAHFSHEHVFETTDNGTLTTDLIRYRPPGGPLAGLVDALFVRRDLRKLFAHRHRRMAVLFADGGDPGTRLFAPASSSAV